MIYDIDRVLFSVADNIEDTMDRKGVNTRQLAERMGVKYTVAWNHKSGRRMPTLESCLKLCNALDVDLNELLGVKKCGE